jgi:hypothetical protein
MLFNPMMLAHSALVTQVEFHDVQILKACCRSALHRGRRYRVPRPCRDDGDGDLEVRPGGSSKTAFFTLRRHATERKDDRLLVSLIMLSPCPSDSP